MAGARRSRVCSGFGRGERECAGRNRESEQERDEVEREWRRKGERPLEKMARRERQGALGEIVWGKERGGRGWEPRERPLFGASLFFSFFFSTGVNPLFAPHFFLGKTPFAFFKKTGFYTYTMIFVQICDHTPIFR